MYTKILIPKKASQTEPNYPGSTDFNKAIESILLKLSCPYHWDLFTYITAMSGLTLSEAQKSLIVGSVKLRKLRKRQYFLQEGDICKYIGFITKGSTRMFSVNERGQESIVAFGLEHSWIADFSSFNGSNCSKYNIEATENTEMVVMNLDQLTGLIEEIPAFAIMFNQYQLQQMIYSQKRINAALSMTAEERYYDLLTNSPQYSQRFSQNMLACYLGVKPETLSRIRKCQSK